MICPKCGRNNPDGMACPCGAPLLSSNPAVNLLKSLGSSPLFLAAAILATAAPVLFILALVTSGGQYVSGLISFRYTINGQEFVYPSAGNDFGAVVLGSLLFALPVLLAALGMWLFYGSSRNRHTGNVSTAGLTICKVIAIAAVVLCIVAAALYAILLLLLMIFSNAFSEWIYYNSGEYVPAGLFVGLALVALVFFVGLMLLPIFFYFGVIKALNRMKRTARTGEPNDKVSYYVMVFLFILAVFGAPGAPGAALRAPSGTAPACAPAAGPGAGTARGSCAAGCSRAARRAPGKERGRAHGKSRIKHEKSPEAARGFFALFFSCGNVTR